MKYDEIIITGVSGSGKTTVGKRLAEKLNCSFADADDFHAESNINKMKAGIALNDEDRYPWLRRLNKMLLEQDELIVLACSALKEKYRKMLAERIDPEKICWVHLYGSKEILEHRMLHRNQHFMRADMLESQLSAYEPAVYGLHINIEDNIENIVEKILDYLE